MLLGCKAALGNPAPEFKAVAVYQVRLSIVFGTCLAATALLTADRF